MKSPAICTHACLMGALLHSFILDISIAPLQVHYYSEALVTTALKLCWS